ncbi:hypothetical protein NEHOM01_0252 [Nematocida homosporus]|uniref:uncharacterized protein n=1 Tax=Nematocida homosporus TaxID=1912981 RepID=UPI00221F28B8|nr:uncharacterized protein NEHOM01_0252 [Nematocida homosporus]KAI5184577.1 hypothetical protein NEHOM01_0252 [Nematocida homosporus]
MYTAGETISGYILLHVSGVFSVESITLTIDKESAIHVEEAQENLTTSEKALRHLGKFVIYKGSATKVEAGIHKFPFQFKMMPGEGATIDYRKVIQGKRIFVFNKYISRCEVRIYGIFKPVSEAQKEINLVEPPRSAKRQSTHHEAMTGCFCFRKPVASLYLDMDALLYAGQRHQIKISTDHASPIQHLEAVLEMSIKTFSSPPTQVTFPVKIIQTETGLFIELDPLLPSETSKNDFFTISYQLIFTISLKGNGNFYITKSLSIRNSRAHGDYQPPILPESAIYPEKHLSLHC